MKKIVVVSFVLLVSFSGCTSLVPDEATPNLSDLNSTDYNISSIEKKLETGNISGLSQDGKIQVNGSSYSLNLTSLVGYGYEVDGPCEKRVASNLSYYMEEKLAGEPVLIVSKNESEGVSMFLIEKDGVSLAELLVYEGFAVYEEGKSTKAQQIAKKKGKGIWGC